MEWGWCGGGEGWEEGGSETFRVYLADPAGQGGIRIKILIPSNEPPFPLFFFFFSLHFSFFPSFSSFFNIFTWTGLQPQP